MTFYLGGILINDQPTGDIVTTIKRDSQLGGFLVTNDAKLKWHGDGFDYIQSVINLTGFCSEIDCKINDDCSDSVVNIFTGKIFILEIEKNSNCVITAPLQDNNFYARVNKNKSIEINIDTVTSKNGVTISAAAENDITMFVPATGFTVATARRGWRAYDIFSNLIAFMSDGELAFDSTLFGIGGDFEGLSFTTGQELAFAGTGKPIKTSFNKFFDEVKKKLHCTFYIDTTGTIPVLKIEKYENLFLNTIIKKLESVENVRYKVDTTKLIAIISVGSTQLTDAVIGVSMTESNVYQTFKKENYTTLGQCNIDTTLDLVSEFVISSNTIEDCLINGNNNFSDTIFFVDCENVVAVGAGYTSSAILGNPFATAPPYIYNARLFNSEVLERWASVIPNSITAFSGALNNLFRAANTSNIQQAGYTAYFPYQFDNDYDFPNFDTTNLYGNNTPPGTPIAQIDSRYTCPEDGTYIFYHQLKFLAASLSPGSAIVSHGFVRFNSGGVFIQSDGIVDTPAVNASVILTHTASFVCTAGDYIETHVTVQLTPVQGSLIIGSTNETFFSCSSAPNSSGIYNQFNNQNKIAIIKGDFEYKIKNTDFYDILLNPFGKIAFTYNNTESKAGHIDTLQFNHFTSDTKLTLLGTNEMLK